MAAAQRSDAGARPLQQRYRTKAAVTIVWTPRQRAATAGTAEGGGTAPQCGCKAAPAALANQGGSNDSDDADGGGTGCGRKDTPAARANQGGRHDSEDAWAKSRHSRHS
jgi:hypothetical protein